jgi:tRNA dimethylallyltransferase
MLFPTLLIAGPTASGKSAYATARAREAPCVIVNADSMQVYADLQILTARPSPADQAEFPHALYGHVDGAEAYSVGQYLREVAVALEGARASERRAIIVGGTGLYFKALLEGLSPVPEIPSDVRTFWRQEADRLGSAALHAVLADRDPEVAQRLRPSDPQRVTRALEVLEATGQSLSVWHATVGTPLIDEAACEKVLIGGPRDALYARADARFDQMLAGGALDEVRRLAQRQLDPALPIMRALGVPQLLAYHAGRSALDDAVADAKRETRRYIKRQQTWQRRKMSSWSDVFAQD